MNAPELNDIIKTNYTGSTDEQGLPHRYGEMQYLCLEGKEYKYKGAFSHGKRQGFGRLLQIDSNLQESTIYFGWWSSDEPKPIPFTKDRYECDFEITHDKEFLDRFLDYRDVRRLPQPMVEKLRNSEDPYAKYGYGQWLFRMQPDVESLKEATECLTFASDNGVADALHVLSYMYYIGDAYSKERGTTLLNRTLSHSLNAEAIERGSELAKLRRNFDLFHGRKYLPANREAAISEAKMFANTPGASPLWIEQLGWFYDAEDRYDEAIEVYNKSIEEGVLYPIYELAIIFLRYNEIKYYEEIMREGIKYGVPSCLILGFEKETEWDNLSAEEQRETTEQLKRNLELGVKLGDNNCVYLLAYLNLHGRMGFEQNIPYGVEVAYRGVQFHDLTCCLFIMDVMNDAELLQKLPEEAISNKRQTLLLMQLKALRYGDLNLLYNTIENSKAYIDMGFEDEIKDMWHPEWEVVFGFDGTDDDEDECKYDDKYDEYDDDKEEEEEEDVKIIKPITFTKKSAIPPTVIIIHPTGITEFAEADIYTISFRDMAKLIGAEALDPIHFSKPLSEITKACRLDRTLTMYADREGAAKSLDDNSVATTLYDNGVEIRGAVIVAMEDRRYDTYSFENKEDIESVYKAIQDYTGGLLRRIDSSQINN